MSERLGKVVLAGREKAGLSLRTLGRRIGVSSGYLSRVESAQASPSDRALRSLARVLGTDVDVMFAEAGRLPDDVTRYLARHPLLIMRVVRIVREAMVRS